MRCQYGPVRMPARRFAALPSPRLRTAAPAEVAPEVARESDLQQLREHFPPYRVILHNDDHHGMDEVVLALCKAVPGLSKRKAILIMLQAHLHGRATVIVCPREQAEYYAERLGSYGLTVTIERAE